MGSRTAFVVGIFVGALIGFAATWLTTNHVHGWDTQAVTAELSRISVNAETGALEFQYVIKNNGPRDFVVTKASELRIVVRHPKQHAISRPISDLVTPTLPIFVPPGERQVFGVSLNRYGANLEIPSGVADSSSSVQTRILAPIIHKTYTNFGGFVMYVAEDHLAVNLPIMVSAQPE